MNKRKTEGKSAFRIRSISLRDFRNYSTAEIAFDPGFNVVHGPNAQGKTNLLEAVSLLSTTRLLRSSRDSDAIRNGTLSAKVSAVLEPNATEISVVLERGVRKRASVNGIGLKRASDLLGRFPSVSVSALDLDIVRGEPSERRLFLDLELSQAYPAYLDALSHYRRALDQRNALLKSARESTVAGSHFETWEEPLAKHGARLRKQRIEFVERLDAMVRSVHPSIAPGERIGLGYERKDDSVDCRDIEAELERNRDRDVQRGSTSIGPHRDDLSIEVDGMDLRAFGSQGQQRSGVVTLKLASLNLAEELQGAKPALLLDDVFSDLDEGRRSRLVEWVLEHAGQAILTCTEASAAGTTLLGRAKLFRVEAGRIEAE